MSTVPTSTPRVLTKGSASGGQPRSAPRPGQRTSVLTPQSTPLLCSEDSITTTVSPPEALPLARMGEVAITGRAGARDGRARKDCEGRRRSQVLDCARDTGAGGGRAEGRDAAARSDKRAKTSWGASRA